MMNDKLEQLQESLADLQNTNKDVTEMSDRQLQRLGTPEANAEAIRRRYVARAQAEIANEQRRIEAEKQARAEALATRQRMIAEREAAAQVRERERLAQFSDTDLRQRAAASSQWAPVATRELKRRADERRGKPQWEINAEDRRRQGGVR